MGLRLSPYRLTFLLKHDFKRSSAADPYRLGAFTSLALSP